MNDLIDRQAAIEALRKMQTYKLFSGDDMLLIDQAGAQTELMLLPPAQPDVPDINVGDTISRQAAIDEIKEIYEWHDNVTKERIIEHFKQLPTAQPEHIKGHWVNGRCDKCNEHAPFWCMASTYYASNFCPNCGAEMEVTT